MKMHMRKKNWSYRYDIIDLGLGMDANILNTKTVSAYIKQHVNNIWGSIH